MAHGHHELAEGTRTDMPEPVEFHAKRDPATGDMEVEAVYEPSEATRLLAELAVNILNGESASNFFTFEVTAPEMRVSITIQKMHGATDTPAGMLSRCKKENEALRQELDAIRKAVTT